MVMDDTAALPVKTDEAAALLKAMGNERRLSILPYLSHGEKSAGEMEELVGLSQSALSQYLAILRQEGLVRTRRQAPTIFYGLADGATPAVLSLMRRLYPA